MFEFDHDIVENLLIEDSNFKRLYDKHILLKQRVNEVHDGVEVIDDFTLENMKKEKLMLKDKLAAMIEDYRRAHI